MRTNDFMGIVGIFLPAIALSSCAVVDSSQVSATTDCAAYSAQYNAQSNSAQYNAHFSVGGGTGTVLDLNGNSTVTIDGNSMTAQTDIFNDLNYVATESALSPSSFAQSHEFSFVDQSGNAYKNDFTFPSLIAVGASSLELTLCNMSETSNIQADTDGGTLEISSCSQEYSVTLN
jgi:hypothetical protein